MRTRQRVVGLLVLLAVVVAAKLGQQLYRWVAYRDERAMLAALGPRLEDTGVAVVRSQVAAESLRAVIEGVDRDLALRRERLAAYGGLADDGGLPRGSYAEYRVTLAAYNLRVDERNRVFERWKETVVRNHDAVGRFNVLADSMRLLAGRIGEPYYRVPTPPELAAEHLPPPAGR